MSILKGAIQFGFPSKKLLISLHHLGGGFPIFCQNFPKNVITLGTVHKCDEAHTIHLIEMRYYHLGKDPATKSNEFLEKCQRGVGELFSIQRFILQILGTLNRAF